MGYISSVKICMKKTSFEELKQELMGKYDYLLKMLDECVEQTNYMIKEPEVIVVFGWESIKWHSSFEEIQLIQNFLDKLGERGEDYSFIRLGEEYGDIEQHNNYVNGSCDILHAEHYISVD